MQTLQLHLPRTSSDALSYILYLSRNLPLGGLVVFFSWYVTKLSFKFDAKVINVECLDIYYLEEL